MLRVGKRMTMAEWSGTDCYVISEVGLDKCKDGAAHEICNRRSRLRGGRRGMNCCEEMME